MTSWINITEVGLSGANPLMCHLTPYVTEMITPLTELPAFTLHYTAQIKIRY